MDCKWGRGLERAIVKRRWPFSRPLQVEFALQILLVLSHHIIMLKINLGGAMLTRAAENCRWRLRKKVRAKDAATTPALKGGAMSFEAAKAHLEQYGLADRVEELVGHVPGGVCPFAVRVGVPVYLDESLRCFEYVYPVCGSSNSAVRLTPAELERASGCVEWVDVYKLPEVAG